MADPKELARRLALLLTIGDPSIRKITDAEREVRHDQDFAGLAGPPEVAVESDGTFTALTTSDGDEVSVEPAAGPHEPAEPRPPSEGKTISFGELSIVCDGPMRPSLPPVYSTRRGGLGIHHGTWISCLALVRQIVGDPLPEGLVSAADDTVEWRGRADQGPTRHERPVGHRGHEAKRR